MTNQSSTESELNAMLASKSRGKQGWIVLVIAWALILILVPYVGAIFGGILALVGLMIAVVQMGLRPPIFAMILLPLAACAQDGPSASDIEEVLLHGGQKGIFGGDASMDVLIESLSVRIVECEDLSQELMPGAWGCTYDITSAKVKNIAPSEVNIRSHPFQKALSRLVMNGESLGEEDVFVYSNGNWHW